MILPDNISTYGIYVMRRSTKQEQRTQKIKRRKVKGCTITKKENLTKRGVGGVALNVKP